MNTRSSRSVTEKIRSSESFDTVADEALAHTAELIQPVSDMITKLGHAASAYEGVVVFALEPSDKAIASAIATVEPRSANLESIMYRKDNITGYRVLTENTEMGKFIRDPFMPRPYYAASRMNPKKQYVYTERITHSIDGEDIVVGAAQYAFTSSPDLNGIPLPEKLESIAADNDTKESFRGIGSIIYELGKRSSNLSRDLERGPSVLPTVIDCHFDVVDSSSLDTGRDGKYDKYLDDINEQIFELINPFNPDGSVKREWSKRPYRFLKEIEYMSRGDGGHVLIPVPADFRFIEPDHPDSFKARVFAKNEVQPLLNEIVARVQEAGIKRYGVVPPLVRFGVDVGYVEPMPNLAGQWSGSVLTKVTKLPHVASYNLSYSKDAEKIFLPRK